MTQACLFSLYCWSKKCNWVYHFYSFYNNDKSRTPPLFGSFFIFIFFTFCDDEGTTSPSALLCVFLHTLASPSGSCSQPLACGRFPMMQCSSTVCDWHQSGGQLEVWPGRRDAPWHVAESVILRGRPGTHQKKIELISTSFFVVLRYFSLSYSGLGFMPLS